MNKRNGEGNACWVLLIKFFYRFSLWSNTKQTEGLTILKSQICKQKPQVTGPGTCGRVPGWHTWVDPFLSYLNVCIVPWEELLQPNIMLSHMPGPSEKPHLALLSSDKCTLFSFMAVLVFSKMSMPKYSRGQCLNHPDYTALQVCPRQGEGFQV